MVDKKTAVGPVLIQQACVEEGYAYGVYEYHAYGVEEASVVVGGGAGDALVHCEVEVVGGVVLAVCGM
jgi:hypothetical protein